MNDNSRAVKLVASMLCIGAAFALYRPALRIGLLSDDFALLMWARQLEFAPRDWGQIRPLPIASWWLVARVNTVAGTPAALHALNVALHGCNAVLVWRLARQLSLSPAAAVGGSLLFLVMPTNVEPVAWNSGVFDVMLAVPTLLLAVIVTSRPAPRLREQVACVVLALLMLASKETGIIAGPLVLLLSWVRWRRVSRRTLVVVFIQMTLAVTYAAIRELTGRLDHRLTPTPTLGGVGRLVSGTARALFVPLHEDLIRAHPVLAAAWVAAVLLALASWLVRTRRSGADLRVAALAVLGPLLCVAPAIRIFGITPDLQGTRYVYLAGAWWTIALASALLGGWNDGRLRIAGALVTGMLLAGSIGATRYHLHYWTEARAERDRVLRALAALPITCAEVSASGVADNVRGAYVFRNGLNEALATIGRSYRWVDRTDAAPECQVALER